MAHSFAPFSGLEDLAGLPTKTINVGRAERIGSALVGGAFVTYALARRNLGGNLIGLVGGALLYRGASGKCACYRKLGLDTTGHADGRGVPGEAGVKVERSIHISRSAMELYHFWHDLANLPRVMPHVKSVTVTASRSHWVVAGPAGRDVEWDAEFINEVPGVLLAWQSLPGSQVRNAGSVHFEPIEGGGGGTRVKVAFDYLPPGGRAGALAAHVLGVSPGRQLEADLRRFKEEMEAAS